ncbi:hypothetical protein CRU87_09695 [Aliarcobacter trophiarum LMG 25534]|uniref:Uncharacterized protein n=1 Tax=Aliarcobacter trophiarum LMG 25534 TaxID=1032241 RepID=A0AAD0VM32_9BACT|nr:hypothetical protein [Aliarcobacter trophiarum]AXK49008.1 hypothetical protein ATR_1145 [Aliarcobacter trophiarum LMG 25534]RXI26081.1 hypothetical protein CRU89_07185 [Aliarcobacter trophiarum]RXJ88683.1 hypothetical protein CRU87_09695 [Aliarcobacter trophiarum LMG 25534]
MLDKKNSEIYTLTMELLEYVENEYLSHKHDFNDISKRIFLKDIINKVHEVRILVQKYNLHKEQMDVKEF